MSGGLCLQTINPVATTNYSVIVEKRKAERMGKCDGEDKKKFDIEDILGRPFFGTY